MDVDEDSDQNALDTSAWAFIEGSLRTCDKYQNIMKKKKIIHFEPRHGISNNVVDSDEHV